MLKSIIALVAVTAVSTLTVAAEKPAATNDKAVKICEKTGKACTGKKDAAHNCKKGDKECSKDKAAAKMNCKKADKKCSQEKATKICEKTGKACSGGKNAAHNCKKGDKECSKDKAVQKHQCKKAAAKANICEKTGKACSGGKNAAHNCKKGDKECSKDKTAPAKK